MDPVEIPIAIVDRYRKLKALASSSSENEARVAASRLRAMEEKHPGIGGVVDRLEQIEQQAAARKHQQWVPPRPTREEIDDLIPGALRKVGKLVGLNLADMTENLLDWAIRQIELSQDEYLRSQYKAGEPIEPGGMMFLTELIESELDVEIDAYEDEDSGEELLEINIVVPIALWRQIADHPQGAAMLVRYLDQLQADAEPEDG